MLARTLLLGGSGDSFAIDPATAYNDEFDDGQGDWQIWDVLGHDADFNVTSPGRVYMESGLIVTRAGLPTPPFVVEAHCASIVYDNINTPGNATLGVGYTPTNTTNGGFYGLEWDIDTPGAIGIYDGEFIPMFGDEPTHYGTIQNNTVGTANQVPHWQRMIVHSADNIDLYWSKTGTSFTTYATGVNPIVTLQSLYLVSFACTTTWEYVRFWTP